MMGIWTTLTETISLYTGLSPTAYFTIIALMVVTYKLVSGMFVSPDHHHHSQPNQQNEFVYREPEQLGEVTPEELVAYDGSDPNKPLLMAIKGQIYDVSRSRMFYGPGGPYALFAGREASRALALMSFEPKDLNGNLEGLGPSELEVLQDWEYKFMEKYVKVGQLVQEKSATTEAIVQNQETKTEVGQLVQEKSATTEAIVENQETKNEEHDSQ